MACSAESSSPLTLETIGIFGSLKLRVSAISANSSSIGSISGEWKAWETARRLVLLPFCSHWVRIASTASSLPEITIEVGPLIAAIASSLSLRAIDSVASSSVASIAAMAPPSGGHHQAPACGDRALRRHPEEDARDMGGGDLADRVAGEQVWLEAALGEGLTESHLDREEGGLGVGGVLELRCRFLALGEDDLLSGVCRWWSSCSQTESKAAAKCSSAS